MPRRALFLLFFGSGASGLVYQVLWMRALSLTMSVSVYAATTVLCAFMAGLALGSLFAGRVAEQLVLRHPGVRDVARRTGRAESDEHDLGVEVSELDA